jgi:uracil-DNA glycosylase
MLDEPERRALQVRLEWLRLMGIDEIRMAGRIAAAPGLVAGPRAGSVQAGLFEDRPAGQDGEASKPGPRRGRSESGMPPGPLASIRAPQAPDPASALRLIREEIGDCRRCRLSGQRTNIVFGVGSASARLMFVGEGPGADEDRQGEPFVGRAGQLLTKIIESMGLRREDVYIANVVKCRPPDNRTPLPDEVGVCSPFLFQQIAAIRPAVVVCLGTPAAQTILGTSATITRLRGAFREVNGIQVMPTFHPAYLLRNPAAKKEVWEDMKKVMALLKSAE